ncbi:MAG: energy transducer TonB [Candidatus Omnitrophota bacterium]
MTSDSSGYSGKDGFGKFILLSVCLHALVAGTQAFSFKGGERMERNIRTRIDFLVERPVRIPEVFIPAGDITVERYGDEPLEPGPPEITPGKRLDDRITVDGPLLEKSVEKEPFGFTEGHDEDPMSGYRDLVRQRIEEHRNYPLEARRKNIEGVTFIFFTVLSDGSITNAGVTVTSGNRVLDEEALSTVKKASPLPPLPEGIESGKVMMEVPIIFSFEKK